MAKYCVCHNEQLFQIYEILGCTIIGVGAIFDWGGDGFLGAHRGPKMADWGP